jgi:hypothetical protein
VIWQNKKNWATGRCGLFNIFHRIGPGRIGRHEYY